MKYKRIMLKLSGEVFSGDAEYFVSDVRSVGREDASLRAVDRLARNIVDRIVEDW